MNTSPDMNTSQRFVSAQTDGAPMVADTNRGNRAAWAAGVVTTAAMIATPLVPRGGGARRLLSSVVVLGLAATTTANAGRRWGVRRTGAAALGVAVSTAVVERVGTRTGVPFGRYEYSGDLRPQIAGVPAIVPLAWFAMAVPSREAARAALGGRSSATGRVVVGAAALTAWDLFLDPQMVAEGYWRWIRGGVYRGIPLSNFAGWFVTGLAVMMILERALPPEPVAPDAALVQQYGFMAVMETVGFARYFRDPIVAAVGGAAMLPLAAVSVVRTLRR